MKKRKLKNSFKILLLIIILLAISVIFLENQEPKKEEKTKKLEPIEEKLEPVSNKKTMSLVAVGDVLIHESVYLDAKTDYGYDFDYMFEHIQPIVNKYDLRYCNQESIIGGPNFSVSGYPSFNSPDEIGDTLVDYLGFNLISLANNHTMDKGETAANYSVNYWKNKKVNYAGSYLNDNERNDIPILEKNGIKYAFLAYTTISNGNVPSGKSYLLNIYSDEIVKNDIQKIKDKVDVLIVSMHWGEENTNTPTKEQRRIAKYLSSLGVNIIIGAHPHVVQPIEYEGDTLVIYSLGNFISNQLSIRLNNGIGLIVGLDIVVEDGNVTFENLYKELTLAYANNSTNFSVIPFYKLDEEHLPNYKSVQQQYMKIVNGG